MGLILTTISGNIKSTINLLKNMIFKYLIIKVAKRFEIIFQKNSDFVFCFFVFHFFENYIAYHNLNNLFI